VGLVEPQILFRLTK